MWGGTKIGNAIFIPVPIPKSWECNFSFPFPFPKFGNGLSYSRSRSQSPKSHSRSPLEETQVVHLLTPPIIHLQHHGRCTLKHQVLNCDVLVPQVQSTFYVVEVPFLGVVPLGQCSVYSLQSKAGLLWDIQGTPGQCAQQREGVGLGQCSLYKCSCLGVGRPGLRRIEWLLPEPTLQSPYTAQPTLC